MLFLLLACLPQLADTSADTAADDWATFDGSPWAVATPDHLPGYAADWCREDGCRECVELAAGGDVLVTWWSTEDPTPRQLDGGTWGELGDGQYLVNGEAWTVTPEGAEVGFRWTVELDDGTDWHAYRCRVGR